MATVFNPSLVHAARAAGNTDHPKSLPMTHRNSSLEKSMDRRLALRAGPLLAAAALGGCATTADNVDPSNGRLSVVVGFVDMAKAPSSLQWVSIKAYGPGSDHFFKARVDHGVFFHIGVDPGSYQIDRFGGRGGIPLLTSRPFEYEWGTRGRNATAIRIQQPGVYYLGAYEYLPENTGFFEPGRFSMRELSRPGEREVLQRALAVIEGDAELRRYTIQIERLRRRIASLPT